MLSDPLENFLYWPLKKMQVTNMKSSNTGGDKRYVLYIGKYEIYFLICILLNTGFNRILITVLFLKTVCISKLTKSVEILMQTTKVYTMQLMPHQSPPQKILS